MSKRKGPFLITDLASKLGSAPSPARTPKTEADLNSARNAYGFIAANYQQAASDFAKSGSNQVQIESESGSNRVQNPVQTGFKSGSEKLDSKPGSF